MRTSRRRVLGAVARLLGLEVTALDQHSLLLQERPARRAVTTVGAPDLRTALVWDRRRARRRVAAVQRRLSEVLLEEQVAWVLRATEVDLVLDVGGNVGQFGRALRRRGYRGRIVSFEPVAASLTGLRDAAASDPLWDVHGYALGATSEHREMHTVAGTLSSMLAPSDFGRQWGGRLDRSQAARVEVRRLDEVFDEVTAGLDDPRVFLKMDTQGFDLEVFAGAQGALDRVVGLLSEVACVPLYAGMPRLPEQLAAYEAAGFETAGMFQVSRDVPTLRVIEFDLVMVRAAEVRDPRR